MAQIDIRIIPPLTVDEEAFLLRERGITPWRRMSRAEIEEQYPGALKPINTDDHSPTTPTEIWNK